jgi:hypothetical protein
MKTMKCLGGLMLAVMVCWMPAKSVKAQDTQVQGNVPVRVLVSVSSKHESPEITKDDVLVYKGKERLAVTAWTAATGPNGGLQLAVIIDDSTSISAIGNQLGDIAEFIRQQDQSTLVGVFYAQNGTVTVNQDFTTDHEKAAKALRLPIGRAQAFASPYLSLMDFMKRWPATQDRREILLVSDGIDRFRGDPFSPDVPDTAEAAQKTGVMIHTIYAQGVGRVDRNMWRVSIGQSNLAQITDETGGESYFQGTYTPIAFSPYLDMLNQVLHHQYWLTFQVKAAKKPELQSVKVTTEVNGVEISAPRRVLVPAAQ